MGVVVYGSELSAEKKEKIRQRIDLLKETGKRIPCLAVILVGSDPASVSYVKGKEKACLAVGMKNRRYHLAETCTQEELEALIQECNRDSSIDGILLQLPLPKGLNNERALRLIDPDKDVDGLHPTNVARLQLGKPGFVPCTPKGIIELLHRMGVEIAGKHAVVVGRSQLVGGPVSRLLLNENATVTVCHSHTADLSSVCRMADILVVAVGRPKMITADYVRKGAYVIDVGVNRMPDGTLCGDVDFAGVKDRAAAITPVPKGVGPMTICSLLENTMQAYEGRMK